jgi:hypothetical protein
MVVGLTSRETLATGNVVRTTAVLAEVLPPSPAQFTVNVEAEVNWPVVNVPDVPIGAFQPPEAEQKLASMLPHVRVVGEPGKTLDGVALIPAWGCQPTNTVVETVVASPPAVHVSENVVNSHNSPVSSEPTGSRGPDHPSEASQVKASGLFQLS